MRYRNILFDLYGTLVDIRTDEEDSELWNKLSFYLQKYDINKDAEKLKRQYFREIDVTRKKYPFFSCPEGDVLQAFNVMTEEKLEEKELCDLAWFFRQASTRKLKVYEGAMELLSMLKQQGRRIILVSNAQRCYTANELRKLNMTDLFDDIFISSDFHVCKPDPLLWHTVICALGIRPEESLMIGNDYECDILSARKAGMDGMYINTEISPHDDLNRIPDDEKVYGNLYEIMEYLQKN